MAGEATIPRQTPLSSIVHSGNRSALQPQGRCILLPRLWQRETKSLANNATTAPFFYTAHLVSPALLTALTTRQDLYGTRWAGYTSSSSLPRQRLGNCQNFDSSPAKISHSDRLWNERAACRRITNTSNVDPEPERSVTVFFMDPTGLGWVPSDNGNGSWQVTTVPRCIGACLFQNLCLRKI